MTLADAILTIAIVVTISGIASLGLMLRYLRRTEPQHEIPKF